MKSFLEWLDEFSVKKRGQEVSRKKISKPYKIELYRGFDANLEDLETINGKWVLSPKRSEQGMLWFTHIFIGGHDPIEYAKSHGDWLLTYPLIAKKHYELVVYENGEEMEQNPKDILDELNPLENSRYMCVGNGCLELPSGWFFTYKSQKFIGTTNKILVSKEMITSSER